MANYGSLLQAGGEYLAGREANKASDAALARRVESVDRLRGENQAVREGAFQPYNVRIGNARGGIGPGGTTGDSGFDAFSGATDLFNRYKDMRAPRDASELEALQQRLERQGLTGLNRDGSNPFIQAFAEGQANSDAAQFQNFLDQAESLEQGSFGRAQDAAQIAGAGRTQQQALMQTLFGNELGLEKLLVGDQQGALAGQANTNAEMIRALTGLFGGSTNADKKQEK